MEQTRTRNVIQNMIFALINAVVGTVLPFFVRTYTIKYLGSEYMGLNNLCFSILNVLSATDLGMANAFSFRLYKPMAQGDREEIGRLLNFYKKVYFTIGMVILGAGLIILPFFKYFIFESIPQNINVYAVFLIYLINTVISYTVFAYKNLIFSADQRKDYESITTTITLGILYIAQIGFIRYGQYYISVLIMPLCTLFGNLLRNWIANRKYPGYVPHGNITENEKKALKNDIFSVAVYKFRDISRNAFDNIVISTFMGLVVLSNYQNYYMVFTVPIWLLSIFYMSVLPSVGNFAILNCGDAMYGLYKKIVFVMSFVSGWFAIGYGFLIQEFITIWLGAEFRLSWRVALLFALYINFYGEAMVIKIVRESIGLWGTGRRWAMLEMAANLILNILFVMLLGVEGIILATLISMLFISVPVENRIIFNHCFVGKKKDKLISMFTFSCWGIMTAIITGLLCSLTFSLQYANFVYKVFICALIPPLSCVACFYKTEEFKFIKQMLLRLGSKVFCKLKQ